MRKKAKGAKKSPVRSGVERNLDPGSEWLIQDYGENTTTSLEFSTTYNNVADQDNEVDDERVELYR